MSERADRRGPQRERSATRPSDRGRNADPPRLAAYTVLRTIAGGGYANLELPKELRHRRLRGRDAAFATELVYGTTRMRGVYDRIIALAADRPVERIDGGVLDTLRMGAHQLLAMRVPPHAAADTSVALARQVNGAGAAGAPLCAGVRGALVYACAPGAVPGESTVGDEVNRRVAIVPPWVSSSGGSVGMAMMRS